MNKGDFTKLANDYMKYRPSYNKQVFKLILSATGKDGSIVRAADVGAGTGISTKCLIDAGVRDVTAIEPNDAMRRSGTKFIGEKCNFLQGSAEQTGLSSNSFDLITMASSFHWTKTSDALREFDRILGSRGVFAAVWNPRLTEQSVSETEVQKLVINKYGIYSRVSSGLSGITLKLRDNLTESGIFRSVVYVDAVDVIKRTHEEYIGAWRSVNDIQAQLGQEKFAEFIKDVEDIISKRSHVEVHYLTRAWIALK